MTLVSRLNDVRLALSALRVNRPSAFRSEADSFWRAIADKPAAAQLCTATDFFLQLSVEMLRIENETLTARKLIADRDRGFRQLDAERQRQDLFRAKNAGPARAVLLGLQTRINALDVALGTVGSVADLLAWQTTVEDSLVACHASLSVALAQGAPAPGAAIVVEPISAAPAQAEFAVDALAEAAAAPVASAEAAASELPGRVYAAVLRAPTAQAAP